MAEKRYITNFLTKIFPFILGNTGFWEVDSKNKKGKKPYCHFADQDIWSVAW